MTYDEYKQRFEFDPDADELGEGGFGRVFRAWDDERKEDVALKLAQVRPDQEAFSLLQEYERVRHLRHGNIAIYLDCQRLLFPGLGRYDVAWMKYYQAGHLGQLLAKQRLAPAQKTGLLTGILDGLEYLHTRHPFIIHRDLKPANILIVERGERYHPLITDFGISRQGLNDGRSHITNSVKAFSLHFAAPEQGEADELRPNADLWSFGVLVVYVWQDGQLPFRTEGLNLETATGQQQLQQRIRSLDLRFGVWEQVPEPWRTAALACLVPDPRQRLRSCQQVRAILVPSGVPAPESLMPKRLTEQSTQLHAASPTVGLPRSATLTSTPASEPRMRKWNWPVGIAVAVLMVLLLAWQLNRPASSPPNSEPIRFGSYPAKVATTSAVPTPKAYKVIMAKGNAPVFHNPVIGEEVAVQGDTASKNGKYISAKGYYEQAANMGNSHGMNGLGDLYKLGQGVDEDFRQAREWYLKAADLGNADAMINIGVLYENGNFGAQDYRQDREWYQKAINLGNTEAMIKVGYNFANGVGASQDYHQAREWYRKAADLGNTDAMTNIGILYYMGWGVAQDNVQAHNWFQKSADLGNVYAKQWLKDFAK